MGKFKPVTVVLSMVSNDASPLLKIDLTHEHIQEINRAGDLMYHSTGIESVRISLDAIAESKPVMEGLPLHSPIKVSMDMSRDATFGLSIEGEDGRDLFSERLEVIRLFGDSLLVGPQALSEFGDSRFDEQREEQLTHEFGEETYNRIVEESLAEEKASMEP